MRENLDFLRENNKKQLQSTIGGLQVAANGQTPPPVGDFGFNENNLKIFNTSVDGLTAAANKLATIPSTISITAAPFTINAHVTGAEKLEGAFKDLITLLVQEQVKKLIPLQQKIENHA